MRVNRVKKLGGVYHCMSRVVAGEYLLDDRAKSVLCKQLFDVAEFCGVEVYTYCLMSNHFHVLVRVPERVELSDEDLLARAERLYWREDLFLKAVRNVFASADAERITLMREKLYSRMYDVSVFMKEVKQRFSIWYNKNHGRFGVFWAERFKSVLVENRRYSVEMVAAYIDLNPVRAGLVKDPKYYRYSGYGEAMAGVHRSIKGLMQAVHEDDWKRALEGYRELLFGKGSCSGKEGQQVLGEKLVKTLLDKKGKLSRSELLRCKIKYFSDGLIIGSKSFVERCHDGVLKRKKKSWVMLGGEWGDMMVSRNCWI